MNIQPINHEAYKLLHDGSLAFARAEQRGMLVDEDYCHTQVNVLQRQIAWIQDKLLEQEEAQLWQETYGRSFNWNSDEQLSDILFKKLGYKTSRKTDKSDKDNPHYSVDKLSLISLPDSPLATGMMEMRKLQTGEKKLKEILRETYDGVLRPSFGLNMAISYRSSCSNPNWHNNPVRDKYLGKVIRRAFKPRPGFLIVDSDYGRIEVHGASWLHKDPNMLKYLHDATKDMHRDMAIQCYLLLDDDWTKDIRYCAKNKFVFPEFYGSYFVAVAKSLWNAIQQMDLCTKRGVSLKKHLMSKGIKTYQQFETHIKKVEHHFWNERFPIYRQWKIDWYEQYQKDGYIESLDGFRFQGYMRRNQVINLPTQCVAFHCLLKAFIEINRISEVERWKSGLIGQIHDDTITEVHESEYNRVIATINRVMCEWVPEQWKFIITPLDVENEVSPIGESWYDKEEVQKAPYGCDCRAKYLYERKDDEGACIGWDCPVCGNEMEGAF